MSKLNVFEDSSVRVCRIRGDWMVNGQIQNYNRTRFLDVVLVDGMIREIDDMGYVSTRDLEISIAGEIEVGGASIGFLPDDGEMARIGVGT